MAISDEVAVGDLNSSERGSGARRNGGKIQFSLVPLHLLGGVARVLMGGKRKYAPWNWAKGMDWSTAFDSGMRHLVAFWYGGEDYDLESGEHHLSHVICNMLFLLHFFLTWKEGDDRPPANAAFAETLKEMFTKFEEPETTNE